MIRFLFLVLFLFGFLLFGIPMLVIEWLLGKCLKNFNQEASDYRCLRVVQWAFRVLLWITGVDVTVIGEENVPDEPVLFIANHRSYFDILLTYSRCRRLTGYVAKKEMLRYPINAYVLKTGLSRPKLSHLMDAETWMDANKAVELGFADEIMARAKAEPEKEPEEGEGDSSEEDEEDEKKFPPASSSMLFSRRAANNALLNKLAAKYGGEKPKADIQAQAEIPAPDAETGRSVDALMERLNLLKR